MSSAKRTVATSRPPDGALTRPSRSSISQWPECRIAVPAALRVPALAGDLGQVRLAVDRAVELERRVAAEDEPVDGSPVGERADHGLGLRRASSSTNSCGAAVERRPRATTASSSTPGGIAIGLDADRAQGRQPGRRRRGEVEPHASSFASVVAARISSTDGRDAGPRGRTRRYQHRARRHQCRAARRPRGLRRRRDPRRAGGRADHRQTQGPASGAPTRSRVLEPRPHRRPHVWPEASVDRAPERRARRSRLRPHRARPPARAEAPGAHRRPRAHGRRRARRASSRSRRCRGADRRAPDGAPACACTSTTDGALGPYAARSHRGHRGRRSCRSRPPSSPRSHRSANGSPRRAHVDVHRPERRAALG